MEIPTEYENVYNDLLSKVSDYGVDIIKDCKADCKGDNRKIIRCWNIFQSACTSYVNGNIKQGNLFINYIISELGLSLPLLSLEQDTPAGESSLNVSTKIVSVSSLGSAETEITIPFTASDEITRIDMVTDVTWCNVDEFWTPEKDSVINVKCDVNTTYTSRSCTIHLVTNTNIKEEIKLIQLANENNNWN